MAVSGKDVATERAALKKIRTETELLSDPDAKKYLALFEALTS